MRTILILFAVLLCCCNHPGNSDTANKRSDTTQVANNSRQGTDTINNVLLMALSTEILKSIKARDYYKLATFIHPQDGICFSPYANIDTTQDKIFRADEFLLLVKQNKRIKWNSSWEEADPELMTVDQYFKKYVYDVDFLSAEIKSVNTFHNQGTDLNNIKEVYPGCNATEFFFSGFEKKYDGMDFRAVRLVFKPFREVPYLIAIVHDQWTP